MQNEKLKKVAARLWHGWVKPFIIVLIVFGAVRSAVADWNDVPTGSMIPSIIEGDRIFVNKLAYDLHVPFFSWRLATWGEPKRGDVIVFFEPSQGQRFVKRVIGLPGDTVEVRGNRVIINGEPATYEPADKPDLLLETLGDHTYPVRFDPRAAGRPYFAPVKVPEGDYFVMGDNRNVSFDSRYFGFVARDTIAGRATAVVISLDHKHYYAPRWGRFFTSLP